MAEKPKLKKSDEILGSIATEPSRGKRQGGERRPAGKDEKAPKTADIKMAGPSDDDEEEFDLSDQQVVLPSAQTLAEKLLAREDKRRQLNFAKYELPRRGAAPQGEAAQPRGTAAGGDSAPPRKEPPQSGTPRPAGEGTPVTFETKATPSPTVSFNAAPEASFEAAPAVTFGISGSQAAQSPQAPRERAPRIFKAPGPQERTAAPSQTFEAQPGMPQSAVNSFDDGKDTGGPREFDLPGGSGASRNPRERSRRKQPKPEAPPDDESRDAAGTQFSEATFEPKPTPKIMPFIETEFEPEPAPEQKHQPGITPPPKPEPKPEPELSERERIRQEFLKRLESQFKTQFEEKFEEGTLKEREVIRQAAQAEAPVPEPGEQKRPRLEVPTPKLERPEQDFTSEPAPNPNEDFLEMVQRQERERMNREAAGAETKNPEKRDNPGFFDAPQQGRGTDESPAIDFISRFEQEVKEEERVQSEDFKETLAEKFERERQRYLKELDVKLPEPREDEPTQSAPHQSQRRKLDFQIQPEMHMSGEAGAKSEKPQKPAQGPVTYTRGAVATPQVPVEDDGDTTPKAKPPSGKKTSEQLLMEHGQRARTAAVKPAGQKPETINFKFSTPEEQKKEQKQEQKKTGKTSILPTEKWPRRIFYISAVTGLFAFGLLLIPLIRYVRLLDNVGGVTAPPAVSAVTEDTLSIYEDRTFTQTAKLKNAVFKSAGLTLTNADISEYVLIEGIDSSGKIRLADVSVGSAVSLKSGGIDTLELHNVKAERVIINNTATGVSIFATGDTDIGVIELRTPAEVKQSDISDTAPGIRGVVVVAPEEGGAMNAALDSLNLRSLETQADESVLVFKNGTRAESMSSDGSLSLSGSGRVMNLSIGAKVGQGAGDASAQKDVSLLVKGVEIINLNVKSQAVLNLASRVDNVSVSHPATVGGEGSVATLTLNPLSGLSRLPVEIAGLTVQNLYANTASRINITGSAKVNILTADASVYLLGNKVNRLVVNADDVAYETEPDDIAVAVGIKPPQSKAENPNLDFDAPGSAENGDILSAIGDDFSTTCGHSRESGGFLLGNGSLDAPYEVATALQLAHVGVHPESYFLQSADIDISTESRFSGGFPMICSTAEPFAGVYNGGGLSISNLRVTSADDAVGLFAANKGVIENVKIVSGSLAATSAQIAEAGGIVGANMAGGQIRSSSNGASVTGGSLTSAGGIAGYNRGKIHDCYNYAKIAGQYQTGGLVGLVDGSGSVTGSYNAGTVEGTKAETGAVAGKNDGATVANCYFLEGTADTGIGSGSGTTIEKSSEYLSSPQMVADLAAGNDASLWTSPNAPVNGYGYPVHKKP